MNKSSKKLHPRDSPYASLMHPARHPGFPASFFSPSKSARHPQPSRSLLPWRACSCPPARSAALRRGEVEDSAEPHRLPGWFAAGCAMATGAGTRPDGRSAPRGDGGGGLVPRRAAGRFTAEHAEATGAGAR